MDNSNRSSCSQPSSPSYGLPRSPWGQQHTSLPGSPSSAWKNAWAEEGNPEQATPRTHIKAEQHAPPRALFVGNPHGANAAHVEQERVLNNVIVDSIDSDDDSLSEPSTVSTSSSLCGEEIPIVQDEIVTMSHLVTALTHQNNCLQERLDQQLQDQITSDKAKQALLKMYERRCLEVAAHFKKRLRESEEEKQSIIDEMKAFVFKMGNNIQIQHDSAHLATIRLVELKDAAMTSLLRTGRGTLI